MNSGFHRCRQKYHLRQNDYRCKSLINSKTISVSKKIQIFFYGMKLQTSQVIQIFVECRNIVGGASVHISKHSLFRLKITVGCRLCMVWCGVSGVRVVCVRVSVPPFPPPNVRLQKIIPGRTDIQANSAGSKRTLS